MRKAALSRFKNLSELEFLFAFWPHSFIGQEMPKTADDARVSEARRAILEIAQQMLDGELSFIEGSRKIAAWSFAAELEWDADILPFVGIASETDALPVGDERQLWNATALEDLQPKIHQSESWARQFGEIYCSNLIKRFT